VIANPRRVAMLRAVTANTSTADAMTKMGAAFMMISVRQSGLKTTTIKTRKY
jgi:hypothetical protein